MGPSHLPRAGPGECAVGQQSVGQSPCAHDPSHNIKWSSVTWGIRRRSGQRTTIGVSCKNPLGDPSLPSIAGDGFFPLSDPAWLESNGETTLIGSDTRSYVAQDDSWSGLDALHVIVLSDTSDDSRRAYEDWQERRHEKAEADERFAENAVERLGTVLETSRDGVGPGIATGDPLLAACQVVGGKIGVERIAAPGSLVAGTAIRSTRSRGPRGFACAAWL
jgi:hypothetical protein